MSTAIRLKFSRKGPASYLGHLDVLRYFQKALSRASIDMKYSEGFNPHMILSFAYPLGVSMDTEGDYADIEVNSFTSVQSIVDSLNQVMNEGISIVSANVVPKNMENAMASVAMASYRVLTDFSASDPMDLISKYLSQENIFIEKEGKKGKINTTDILPGIIELKLDGNVFEMSLLSGSSLNIKPASVLETLSKFADVEINIQKITRTEIYRLANDKFVPLGEF